MIVWVDLESMGLDPRKDRVLEVAAIITDDALVEVARFQSVTTEARHLNLDEVDPYVREMHVKNGLWHESILAPDHDTFTSDSVQTGEGCYLANVGRRLFEFINAHCGGKDKPILAGNTVSFDRNFMQVHLPSAFGALHYRNLDVTSLNEFIKRFMPEIHAERPRGPQAAHRAMPDIEESLATARYYATKLGPVA